MQNNTRATMTFALDLSGRIKHIDEVENGAACACTCPHCHTNLVAKNGGAERAHHFAHGESFFDDGGCAETALHKAAKQIIADAMQISLPVATTEQLSAPIVALHNVQIEHRLENPFTGDWIVVDCYAQVEQQMILFEIAVHHLVDSAKAQKIKDLNLQAIEIDLSDWGDIAWQWDDLEMAVLYDPCRRNWIHVPPSQEIAVNQSFSGESWKFSINGKWIWVSRLPFGNYKVYHKPDEQLRSIVELICRGNGFWRGAPYFNWVVFERFKTELLSGLLQHGKPV